MEIIKVVTFSESIRFDEYIDHFYALKVEASEQEDKAKRLFAKIFLNALYGKFGANPDKYREYTISEHCYIQAAEQDDYYYDAELGPWALLSRELPEEKQHYYNVAVAASITGYVRANLFRSMKQCKGVMYCDTDSIACVDTGELELDSEKLGAWDVEAECDFAAIGGKKLYAFRKTENQYNSEVKKWKKKGEQGKEPDRYKTASKGVKFSAEELIEVAKGVPVTYNPENPSFSLKRGIKFNSRTIQKKD
jgi:hypothetical protein